MKKAIVTVLIFILHLQINAQSTYYEWAKSIYGSGKLGVNDVITDSIGNIYSVGFYTDTADFDTGPGSLIQIAPAIEAYGYIEKHDANGTFLWNKTFEAFGTGSCRITTISIDRIGNLFLAGSFANSIDFDPNAGVHVMTSTGYGDLFILKMDTSGNYLWSENISAQNEAVCEHLVIDIGGNIILSGQYLGAVDFDPGAGSVIYTTTTLSYYDMYILKLDSLGNYIWAKTFGNGLDEFNYGLDIDAMGNVYATGSFHDVVDFDPNAGVYNLTTFNSFYTDAFFLKLDPLGNLLWAKNVGGSFDEYGVSLTLDSVNNIYSSGTYFGTADFDPGPSVYNLNGGTSYILKLDSLGNFIWANSFDVNVKEIALDKDANIYIMGEFNGTVDFDPGAGVANTSSNTTQDMFILKLNANSSYKWVMHLGTPISGLIAPTGITVDINEKIITVGKFYDNTDFDHGPAVNYLIGSSDLFIHKIRQEGSTTNINAVNPDNVFTLFPNPAHNNIVVNSHYDGQLSLINAIGQIVYRSDIIASKDFTIDLSEFSNGIYFILISNDANISKQKFIKQ